MEGLHGVAAVSEHSGIGGKSFEGTFRDSEIQLSVSTLYTSSRVWYRKVCESVLCDRGLRESSCSRNGCEDAGLHFLDAKTHDMQRRSQISRERWQLQRGIALLAKAGRSRECWPTVIVQWRSV